MPIYEYYCHHCREKFEVLQSVNAQPLKTCESCHQPALEKLISATGFQLKGTGWYVTDFKNKSNETKSMDKTNQVSAENKSDTPSQPNSQSEST